MSMQTPTPTTLDWGKLAQAGRLRGLWRLTRGYRLIYGIAVAGLGLSALARTGAYLWLRRLVDTILPSSPSAATLFGAGLVFVGIAALQGGFSFLSGALAARTSEGVALRLREHLFDHIQRLPFKYHDHTPTGELIQRCTSDVDALRRFFADHLVGVGRILMLFGANFTAIASIHAGLAWRSVLAVPAIVLLSYFFFRRVYTAYEAYQQQEAILSTVLQENLSAIRVVKAFARQAFERDKFERENWEKFQRGRHLLTMHSLFWPASDTLANLQFLAGLYLGARYVIAGSLSLGSYLAYAGMLIWIIWPMRNLGRLIVHASMGLVSFGRLLEILREPQEPLAEGHRPSPDHLRGEIVFDRVGFAYNSGPPILQDISFRVEPGEVVALLGPTGSGKSSLVHLLPRFYDYTQGSLRLDGRELQSYSRAFLRSQIGIVEQEPTLFTRSIRENIALGVGREVTLEEVESAARAAAIHEAILSFPNGYDTIIGERGVTLSGGQKQRVAIARVLLKDPRILILDDSTSSVDLITEAEIRSALERLMQGRTTFIIAHRIQSLMTADQILVLQAGKITQQGKHEDLIRQDGIYRRIYEAQTHIEAALEQELTHDAG